jgi:aminodeoxyfutalosine synthase
LPVTGVEDLRIIALSRIVLDNIPHIKAYWVMLGEKTAQVALNFGADDLDGTIVKEKITHAAGAKSKEGLTIDELAFLIKSAGFNPVERDAFYNEIKRY